MKPASTTALATEGTPPSKDRVKIVVFAKETSKPPVMASLVKQLDVQRARVDSEILNDASKVLSSVEETSMTVLILGLGEREELLQVLNLLTQVQERIQSGLLRVILLNGMDHPRVLALLKAKGVQEILEFGTSIKALNYKIKNAFTLVSQSHQKVKARIARTSPIRQGEADARERTKRSTTGADIQWEKPVDHSNDFWWIPGPKNLRHVMGRWLIDLLGPGPVIGTWESSKLKRSGEQGWVWQLRNPSDPTFQPVKGRWIFYGRQPEFSWERNLWSFVSKMPYLAFYAGDESEPEYVRVDSVSAMRLNVFENSSICQAYLAKIQASIEVSLKLPKSERTPITEEDEGGSFLPVEGLLDADAEMNTFAEATEESSDWNDHTGSLGFGFKAKDEHVDTESSPQKWRNALTPDREKNRFSGLREITQASIVTGQKSFERMTLLASPVRHNGVAIPKRNALPVIALSETAGTLELSALGVMLNDRLQLEIEFRFGELSKKFLIDWIVENVQEIPSNLNENQTDTDREAPRLAQGKIVGGQIHDLSEILRVASQRQLELRDFFVTAKGA